MLTNEEARDAARKVADRIFRGATATLDLDELTGLVAGIDQQVDAVKVALIDALPKQVAETLTAPQLEAAITLVVTYKTGLI